MFKLLLLLVNLVSAVDLCTYDAAMKYKNPPSGYEKKFEIMSKIPISIWYSDRDANALNNVKNSLKNCGDNAISIIIYGLPGKDCEAGYSSGGSVKTDGDYVKFITELQTAVEQKDIIYIIEPDALALSLSECGKKNNYLNNINKAIEILSSNKNAKLYLDVGYWKVDELKNNFKFKVKGISLNLSNYRSTPEMIEACKKFPGYSCIIDVSRNGRGPSANNQWCNLISAKMGELPAENPYPNIDFILWNKPALELDGQCNNLENSFQSKKNAGDVDLEYFDILWNLNC